MTDSDDDLRRVDPEIFDHIEAEDDRQANTIRLIASENYASRAVRQATASRLTNKYSEGYPGRRYYQGQEHTDAVENIARNRALELFDADHANVQPYSGSPANLAVYFALLDVGDTILSMGLPFGGHLTHGWKVSATGNFYNAHHYKVDRDTERIDYDEVRQLARDIEPDLIICGASAYPRTIDFEAFSDIADDVDALLLADIAHIAGLVAGGAHPSPVGHADVVTTTTHKTLRGPRGGLILCDDEYADAIDRAVFPAMQGGPHMHAVAAAAVAFREALTDEFKDYADQIIDNSRALAQALTDHNLRVVSGGSDNHLVLVDLSPRDGISGGDAATALEKANIVVNSNTIPYDTRSPFDPSGIRLGTAAVTTRGMDTDDISEIADFIGRALDAVGDDEQLHQIGDDVQQFCSQFPLP